MTNTTTTAMKTKYRMMGRAAAQFDGPYGIGGGNGGGNDGDDGGREQLGLTVALRERGIARGLICIRIRLHRLCPQH